MLRGCNIKTHRPSKKLDHKNNGPFQIEKIVSPLAVRLMLPRKSKIHNVFHLSLLEPYRNSEHRAPLDPSKVLQEADDIEQSEEYDVEEVMSSVERSQGNNKQILYLVKWLDYLERKDWTEEPFDNFSDGGLEKLREFHRQNPDVPRNYWLTEGETSSTKDLAVVGGRGGGLQHQKALRTDKKTLFSGTHEKPLTKHLTENSNQPDELDALLYSHILLTLKRNQRQSKHDGHAIPE